MTRFVGTDIGGTFTDLVGYDSDRAQLFFGKTLTTNVNLVEGVMTCLAEVGLQPASINVLKHGTTQIINALVERNGDRTALVTTAGYRDILEIGRASRPLAFQLDYSRTPPLVAAAWRFEVRERIAADGSILHPLNVEELEGLAKRLEAEGIQAVAIAFINSYRNPVHEMETAAFLRARLPHVYISASTELSREWFEYERTATAVANAYVGHRAGTYLDRFEQALSRQSFQGKLFIMASNGGVFSVSGAKQQPIALVESGPIGGCIGAAAYARQLGLRKLIAFDMGGTTAKCTEIVDLRFEIQATYYVGGYERGFPIRTPVLDIAEVGTGGGSIAYVDEAGQLHVGPRSAGSEPGPVCFGRGGAEPTVTDANLALDRIASGIFLRGALKLDREGARRQIDERVAILLGYTPGACVDAVADGILALANLQMASAIREITVERGRDVRDFDLFAFGGGGPLHGVSLARELRIPRVIIPPEPGNFSALGMLFADARTDEVRTILLELGDSTIDVLRGHIREMREALIETLHRDLQAEASLFERSLEVRFKGQRHSIKVELRDSDAIEDIRSRFFAGYRARYGHVDEAAPVELVGVRMTAFALTEKPELNWLFEAARGSGKPRSYREVYFGERKARLRTPIFKRTDLPPAVAIEGPAVVEEFGSTTVIGPGDHMEVGRLGELIIHINGYNPTFKE